MPSPASKKQFRMMMAILHGKTRKRTARGDFGPPKSIASRYQGQGTGDVESKGKELEGGKWTEAHYAKHSKKQKISEKAASKRRSKQLKKALSDYIKKQQHIGAGCLVLDGDGRILMGMRSDDGRWTTPGGRVEPLELPEDGAVRELREEAGIVALDPQLIHEHDHNGWRCKHYLVTSWKGKVKPNDEFFHVNWFEPHELPIENVTPYALEGIKKLVEMKLSKSSKLKDMILAEDLKKNIIRSGSAPSDTVYELTHGDALRLVGNGLFRFLRENVKDMADEEIRKIPIDTYVIHIRKHVNDVYSGWVTDGHKQVHQWTNRSLPALTAELMSLFEWYLPEDQEALEILDESELDDSVIEGGLKELIDKYKRSNIANIYQEMENIREEIRNGTAVDMQQVEMRIMKLFDRLEENVLQIVDKHNELAEKAGDAIDELEQKLMELQRQIEELSAKPVKVDAYVPEPDSTSSVHEDFYPYLSKPTIKISPSGHVSIQFSSDWTPIERENFLKDMRARVIKRK